MHTYIDLARFGAPIPVAGLAQWDAAAHYRCRAHEALTAHLSRHASDPAIVAALRAGCMPFRLDGSSVPVH